MQQPVVARVRPDGHIGSGDLLAGATAHQAGFHRSGDQAYLSDQLDVQVVKQHCFVRHRAAGQQLQIGRLAVRDAAGMHVNHAVSHQRGQLLGVAVDHGPAARFFRFQQAGFEVCAVWCGHVF